MLVANQHHPTHLLYNIIVQEAFPQIHIFICTSKQLPIYCTCKSSDTAVPHQRLYEAERKTAAYGAIFLLIPSSFIPCATTTGRVASAST